MHIHGQFKVLCIYILYPWVISLHILPYVLDWRVILIRSLYIYIDFFYFRYMYFFFCYWCEIFIIYINPSSGKFSNHQSFPFPFKVNILSQGMFNRTDKTKISLQINSQLLIMLMLQDIYINFGRKSSSIEEAKKKKQKLGGIEMIN